MYIFSSYRPINPYGYCGLRTWYSRALIGTAMICLHDFVEPTRTNRMRTPEVKW